jgi:hypothetical protein
MVVTNIIEESPKWLLYLDKWRGKGNIIFYKYESDADNKTHDIWPVAQQQRSHGKKKFKINLSSWTFMTLKDDKRLPLSLN